jgi:uncharacterized protein YndB with AHSA1/START domain
MSNNTMLSREENNRVLVLERIFDAPRELVFKIFKESEHLKHWWGPRSWSAMGNTRKRKTSRPPWTWV